MVPLGYSSQRSANEATSHNGSFDHWNVYREPVEQWKRLHVCSLSKNVESRVLEKETEVRPIVRDGSWSPQWSGARQSGQGTVRIYFVDNAILSRLRQRHAAPLKSPATKSMFWEIIRARMVWMIFLAMLLMCSDNTVKTFGPLTAERRRGT